MTIRRGAIIIMQRLARMGIRGPAIGQSQAKIAFELGTGRREVQRVDYPSKHRGRSINTNSNLVRCPSGITTVRVLGNRLETMQEQLDPLCAVKGITSSFRAVVRMMTGRPIRIMAMVNCVWIAYDRTRGMIKPRRQV
jgi:hypothetical protein